LSDARRIAFAVLHRVATTNSYSDALLHALLARQPAIPDHKRRLATEIVFGVLRNQSLIDHYLSQAASFQPSRTDIKALVAARIGVYQVLFLDRVPDFAAVNEAVQLAREFSGEKAARFVNALLRKLVARKAQLAQPSIELDGPQEAFIRSLALRFSFPEHLVFRWGKRLPRPQLVELVSTLNTPAPRAIRANSRKTKRGALAERLRRLGFRVEESRLCPEGLKVSGRGWLEKTKEWQEGLFTVQDEGAQLLAVLLRGLKPRTIADLCAGIGQKLTHLAEMLPGSTVVGNDLHRHKILRCRQQLLRLGAGNVRLTVGDVLSCPFAERSFDLVILDAPCSGTGTIRRHPEIRWRAQTPHIHRLSRLQLRLLEACAQTVKPGGALIYSTCSLEPEENEEVVRKFHRRNPDFSLSKFADLPEPLRQSQSEVGITLWPHIHDCDGMFFSLLRRKEA